MLSTVQTQFRTILQGLRKLYITIIIIIERYQGPDPVDDRFQRGVKGSAKEGVSKALVMVRVLQPDRLAFRVLLYLCRIQ